MLYSQGVPLESLGVAPLDGKPPAVETDPRKVWQRFADNYALFRATPTRAWLEYELHEVFGVGEQLNGATAQRVYDGIAERLASPEFRPRALFRRFNIEVLATTDAPADTLEHHRRLQEAEGELGGRVIPCFRPDALFQIASASWPAELERFARASGRAIGSYADFRVALAQRRLDFKALGATATDHAVVAPRTERRGESDGAPAGLRVTALPTHGQADPVERLFAKARAGAATADDQELFEAHLLMEMASLSLDDGLVMQLHAGSLRDHNRRVYERFGTDRGGDIPVATEFTRNLRPLLNAYGNDARFRLIVFTLDESTYSRELAPLAGHYPALVLGAPWWFHDSIEGMTRFRQRTTETAGIYNTAGFNDDTRAFCSIPARHDLARRVDANYLAGLVARHIVDMADAREMATALAYTLAKRAYRL
jgi:glucuronate isomerase